jgi:hypothetical protein
MLPGVLRCAIDLGGAMLPGVLLGATEEAQHSQAFCIVR